MTLYRQVWCLAFCLIFGLTASCFGVSPPFANDHPWLTGPLITPSARLVDVGQCILEPYFFWTVNTGHYKDNWKVESKPDFYQSSPQLVFKAGIYEKINFTTTIQSFYNSTQHVHGAGFGDSTVGLDFEIAPPGEGKVPIKFTIQEILPTGKYQRLKPSLLGTDATGGGSYGTFLGLTFAKLYHFSGDHYMNVRMNLGGTYFAPTHVRGINAYGGDPTTHGKVFPGSAYNVFFAAEYTLTKNWALALDVVSILALKSRFKGHTAAAVGLPLSSQFSLAPAIEYNWNASIGVIIGSWFSIAGKNAPRFVNATGAINYVF